MTRLASPASPGSLYCATRMPDEGCSAVQPSGVLKVRSPGTLEVGVGMPGDAAVGAALLRLEVVTTGAGALQAANRAASASRMSALSVERIINEYLAIRFGVELQGDSITRAVRYITACQKLSAPLSPYSRLMRPAPVGDAARQRRARSSARSARAAACRKPD